MDERVADYPNVPSTNGKVFAIMRNIAGVENGLTESRQNLVEVNTRASIIKNKHFYKIIAAVLLVIILFLIIGLIILSYEFISEAKQDSRGVCTSEECLRSAANLRLSMDFTVDPCDNFYLYSCGKWKEEHINHGWYSRFSSFETINEKIAVSTLEFLNSNGTKREPVPIRQSRDLYKSCVDVDSIDKLGYSVVLKYLKLVGLPQVPTYFTANEKEKDLYEFDWVKVDVKVKRALAKDLFLEFTVDSDVFNRSNNIMYLGSSRNLSPLPSPFNHKNHKKIKRRKLIQKSELDEEDLYEKAYKRVTAFVIKTIVSNVSVSLNEKALIEAVDIIWNITEEISEMAGEDDEYDADYDDLNVLKIKAEELQNLTDFLMKENDLTPKQIWKRYFTMLFEDIKNVTLDLDGKDYIHYLPEDLEYITSMAVYLAKTPGVFAELYAWYQTVYSMIMSTTSEISEYISKESAPFKKYSVLRSRSMDCADLVVDFMGIAVSYGIADRSFLKFTKPKVDEMLVNIKKAFIRSVAKLSWMDEGTKMATLEKTEEMISLIGFPDWLLNDTVIEEYYSGIVIKNDTFLENLLSIINKYVPHRLASLREINPRTWRTDPITVNAYNYFGDNSINIPMAILSFPIYHLGLEMLNYGAIGSVLGHELTHGFDNTGRRFDKYGNLIQWWSNKTIHTFETKTECFIAQYENFSIPNINATVNGKRTLGENLADNGGLNHAYGAYKLFKRTHGEEPQLPGFQNFSEEQMFFIAFGSIWCETRSEVSLISQLKNDEHCPNSLRVLGALQNSHDFAKAFNCPLGSKMNPNRTKCRIW